MDRTKRHSAFQKEVILHVQNEYKGIRLWGIDSGSAYAKHSVVNSLKHLLKTKNFISSMKKLITISYGKVGHPDLSGIYYGRWIGIEIKTGTARQSKDQKFFEKMIKERQGIYIVVTDKYPIEEQLKELNEMREICSM